jgi:hypothetical protein
VNKKAINAGTQALTTGQNGLQILNRTRLVDNGKTVSFYCVADTLTAQGHLFAHSTDTGNTNSHGFGTADTGSGIRVYTYGLRFSQLFGNVFGSLTTNTSPASGKRLLEWHITQSQVTFFVDGVLQWTGAYNIGSDTIPSDSLTLFAKGNASGAAAYGVGAIYELFCTENLALRPDIRNELATRHSITLP